MRNSVWLSLVGENFATLLNLVYYIVYSIARLAPSARPRDCTVRRAIRHAIQVIQHFLFKLFSIYINDIYVVVFVIYELLINIDKINGIG